MHKYIKFSIALIVGVVIGFYLLIIVKKWTDFYVSPTVTVGINPFELFSLVATILLAIYVARTIARANDVEKNEKSLLVAYLAEYKVEFGSKINSMLDQIELDSVLSNSNFKILRKRIDMIISLSIAHKFLHVNDELSVKLLELIRETWELFTDTPRSADPNSSDGIKNDINRVRLEKKSKINMKVIEIEKVLFELMIKIHKR